MKFHCQTILWIINLIFGAAIAFYVYAQSQVNAESAFLESLPEEGVSAVHFVFQGLHDEPSPIGNLLFFSLKDAKSESIEYRYVPVKRNILGN